MSALKSPRYQQPTKVSSREQHLVELTYWVCHNSAPDNGGWWQQWPPDGCVICWNPALSSVILWHQDWQQSCTLPILIFIWIEQKNPRPTGNTTNTYIKNPFVLSSKKAFLQCGNPASQSLCHAGHCRGDKGQHVCSTYHLKPDVLTEFCFNFTMNSDYK